MISVSLYNLFKVLRLSEYLPFKVLKLSEYLPIKVLELSEYLPFKVLKLSEYLPCQVYHPSLAQAMKTGQRHQQHSDLGGYLSHRPSGKQSGLLSPPK